jgi:TRAP-type mannitol/chloroaromatic compound transport system substrate-binding protein
MIQSPRWSRVCTALGAFAALAATPALAQQPTANLKIQAVWPASLTLYENLTMTAERASKLSSGTLKIEGMPAGQVVPPFEVLDATHKKVIDGAHSWAGYWVGKNKAAILFTGGPGGTHGMDFIDFMGWMYSGGGLELYHEFYRDVLKLNVVVIPTGFYGPQAFGWFKKPIRTVADLKGVKCRRTGMDGEIMTRLGMTVVNMPGGEIMPSAQRGVIDCAEWVGGVEDLRFGFQSVWKYHYAPGIHESVTVGELIINGDVWKSLSPQHQEILKSAAMEVNLLWWARWQKLNADALKELQEKHGVQVLRTPPEILRAILTTWNQVAAEEAAKNPFFKKVLDSQRAYASVVVPSKRLYFPPYSFAAEIYFPEKGAAKAAPAKAAAAK